MGLFGTKKTKTEAVQNNQAQTQTKKIREQVVRRNIRRPVITEKSMRLAGVGQYVFIVDGKATKSEIKKEVSNFYKVDVVNVQSVTMKKPATYFRGVRGKQESVKKMIVTLKKGQKIEVVTQ